MTKTPMEIAFDEALIANTNDEVPVGAVITKAGKIIAKASNLTHRNFDPTGHAEIRVIRMACEALQSERLIDCDLYVTLEPCTMCAAAISFARIRRLYFAAGDEKGGAVEHGVRFYHQATCHHRPEVYSGLGERRASLLLKNFFAGKREE
ncbi:MULTISPECIES: nucleoside deaminase [Bartonella]|uniref:nucleoside deaminase n=1 Tax=Bartonella TaxID=773 RepID=UPI0018DECE3A|nr:MULTISPECIES: nucleoside deaminase [Bartonella]MBH9974520.1 nucleoside deaminase [Bartonella choladocola]MBI0014127.1 nucleoside deaminase [Bartonella sp. B10834G3]MBI0139843.1 nucleoside deaminase [Bartonella choladocola]